MQTLSVRLKYLRSREALAALLLPAVIVWRWIDVGGDVAWGLRLGALAMLAWILIQGTFYWHLKLGSLASSTPLPAYFAPLFRTFKWSNLALMAALAALLVLQSDHLSEADVGWSAGLLTGAMLEQINYYYYQLMYDTKASLSYVLRNRRLRKAALGLDMVRTGFPN